jgi:hypothetical protein
MLPYVDRDLLAKDRSWIDTSGIIAEPDLDGMADCHKHDVAVLRGGRRFLTRRQIACGIACSMACSMACGMTGDCTFGMRKVCVVMLMLR